MNVYCSKLLTHVAEGLAMHVSALPSDPPGDWIKPIDSPDVVKAVTLASHRMSYGQIVGFFRVRGVKIPEGDVAKVIRAYKAECMDGD